MPVQVQPCATCRYWDRLGLRRSGLCRIEMPGVGPAGVPLWPTPEASEGCGRHQPIDPNWTRDPIPDAT
jgi:hypothetical protein